MEFNFRFILSPDEYADFNVYSVWSAPDKRNLRIKTFFNTLIYVFGFTITGIALAMLGSGNKGFSKSKAGSFSDPNVWIMAIGVALAITLWVYLTMRSRTRSQAKILVQKHENSHIISETTLLINESELTHADRKCRSVYSWSSIERYVDIFQCYYLYINSVQALIIPKRIFRSSEEVSTFEKLLKEKVQPSSKPL